MSTRSQIGILNKDGSVDSIWCHWDGYPSNNGAILLDKYTKVKDIRALLAGGDIESLNRPYERRGNNGPTHSANVKEFLNIDGWQEYFYLFKGRKWYVSTGNKDLRFVPLTRKMCKGTNK